VIWRSDLIFDLPIIVCVLCSGLRSRFRGVYNNLALQSLAPVLDGGQDLGFDDKVFFMASALDPSFGFHWLQDHPGSAADRDEIKVKVTGMQTGKSLVTSCSASCLFCA